MPRIRYWICGRCGAHLDELESMVNLTPFCHNDDRDCYQDRCWTVSTVSGDVFDGLLAMLNEPPRDLPKLRLAAERARSSMPSEYDVIDMSDPVYSIFDPKQLSYNDPSGWVPEPDWTAEDEEMLQAWHEMDYRWHEDPSQHHSWPHSSL